MRRSRQKSVTYALPNRSQNRLLGTGMNRGGMSSLKRNRPCPRDAAVQHFLPGYHVPGARVGILTHDKPDDDETIVRERFGKEPARMSRAVDSIGSNALMLFDE
jgi:hypothetical protein